MELPGSIIKGGIKLIAFSKKVKGYEWGQKCTMGFQRESFPLKIIKQNKLWYFMAHMYMGQNCWLKEVRERLEWKEYLT